MELLNCLLKEIKEYGIKIVLNKKIVASENKCIFFENGEKINYDFLVNAAGGYALTISKLFGLDTKYSVLPFKGLYLKSKYKEKNSKLIYIQFQMLTNHF